MLARYGNAKNSPFFDLTHPTGGAKGPVRSPRSLPPFHPSLRGGEPLQLPRHQHWCLGASGLLLCLSRQNPLLHVSLSSCLSLSLFSLYVCLLPQKLTTVSCLHVCPFPAHRINHAGDGKAPQRAVRNGRARVGDAGAAHAVPPPEHSARPSHGAMNLPPPPTFHLVLTPLLLLLLLFLLLLLHFLLLLLLFLLLLHPLLLLLLLLPLHTSSPCHRPRPRALPPSMVVDASSRDAGRRRSLPDPADAASSRARFWAGRGPIGPPRLWPRRRLPDGTRQQRRHDGPGPCGQGHDGPRRDDDGPSSEGSVARPRGRPSSGGRGRRISAPWGLPGGPVVGAGGREREGAAPAPAAACGGRGGVACAGWPPCLKGKLLLPPLSPQPVAAVSLGFRVQIFRRRSWKEGNQPLVCSCIEFVNNAASQQ